MGQCWAVVWFPDPDEELVAAVYAVLPASSSFIQFLAHCAALLWPVEPGQDYAANILTLRDMHPDFGLAVASTLARTVQNHINTQYFGPKVDAELGWRHWIHDSCFLHEHVELDKGKCWQRIIDNPHIFAVFLASSIAMNGFYSGLSNDAAD